MGRSLNSILVVDDHGVTVELLARLLRAEGYDVHTALGCRDAIRVALRYECDVVVSDLIMPDGDGCDLLKALRAYRSMPAIAITGHADPSTAHRAHRAGFHRLLVKPLAFQTLTDAIMEARQ